MQSGSYWRGILNRLLGRLILITWQKVKKKHMERLDAELKVSKLETWTYLVTYHISSLTRFHEYVKKCNIATQVTHCDEPRHTHIQ